MIPRHRKVYITSLKSLNNFLITEDTFDVAANNIDLDDLGTGDIVVLIKSMYIGGQKKAAGQRAKVFEVDLRKQCFEFVFGDDAKIVLCGEVIKDIFSRVS
jgi:hypothetical protein